MIRVLKLLLPRYSKAYAYARLMRVDRPIGTLLLLWPTLWALWIAGEGSPSPGIVAIFVLGTFLMRSAGCVINDYLDRGIDGHVARTRARPLILGEVSAREAWNLFLLLITLSFLLLLLLNTLTVFLAFVGAVLAALYPLAKRYTYLPQVHLGLAFGWGIPMAFAAQTNSLPPVAWLLFTANLLWVVVYDTIYAMVDREDDLRIGVKSTAILFGRADRRIIFLTQVLMFAAFLLVAGRAELGAWFTAGLAAAAGFAVYHQYLIRDRRPDQCFKAFLNNNWLGASVFAGLLLHYWLGVQHG